MATTKYKHIQMSFVDEYGNLSVYYPETTGNDVIISRASNSVIPSTVTNAQELANKLVVSAFINPIQDGTTATTGTWSSTKISTELAKKSPNDHSSTETTYGKGTTTKFGHVKISDNYTSSAGNASDAVSASSKALYDAYTALNGAKAPNNHASTAKTYGGGTSANYGHVKLSDIYAVHSASGESAADSVGASSKAVIDAFLNLKDSKAPNNHSSAQTTYGVGTSDEYGHVRLTDDYNVAHGSADNGSIAASSEALNNLYLFTIINMAPKAHASTATTYGGGTSTNYGHVKLSDSYTSSGGAAANSVAASSKALNDAYNALKNNSGTDSGASSIKTYVNQDGFIHFINYLGEDTKLNFKKADGNAEAAHVLVGKTFTSANMAADKFILSGTMPNRTSGGNINQTITPGSSYTIQNGYYAGGTVKCAANSATYIATADDAAKAKANTNFELVNGNTTGDKTQYRYVNAKAVYDLGKSDGVTTHTANKTLNNTDAKNTRFVGPDGYGIDLGEYHDIRNINAYAVYKLGLDDGVTIHTEPYTFTDQDATKTKNGLSIDLGERHHFKTINARKAYDLGHADGYEEGYADGDNRGRGQGYAEGFNAQSVNYVTFTHHVHSTSSTNQTTTDYNPTRSGDYGPTSRKRSNGGSGGCLTVFHPSGGVSVVYEQYPEGGGQDGSGQWNKKFKCSSCGQHMGSVGQMRPSGDPSGDLIWAKEGVGTLDEPYGVAHGKCPNDYWTPGCNYADGQIISGDIYYDLID